MKHKTLIINLISGPGSGKTTTAAQIFVAMKLKQLNIEFVQEYAKNLVWTEKYEILNNQYQVSYEQYRVFESLQGKVDFIVTDGCLLHGLSYNLTNKNNTSNIEKTEQAILKWFNGFENINFFLERSDFIPYETTGRLENIEQARQIDILLKNTLDKHHIEYTTLKTGDINIEKLCELIIKHKHNNS